MPKVKITLSASQWAYLSTVLLADNISIYEWLVTAINDPNA